MSVLKMEDVFPEEEEREEEQGFAVENDSAAEWCLKKIREARAEQLKWQEHYKAQIQRVNDETERTVAFFTAKLEDYFAQVPHKSTKTQESYSLPGGQLIRKAQQPKYSTDDAELIPWLKDNFLLDFVKVRTVESADWAALKKQLTISPDGEHMMTADGEIVPGVSVEQRGDVFSIKMTEGADA